MGDVSLELRRNAPGAITAQQVGTTAAPFSRAAEEERAKVRRRDNAIYAFFICELIGLTILQKLGLGSTPEGVVALNVPMMAIGVVALCAFARPIFPPSRLVLYFATVVTSIGSTAIFADTYSVNSLALFVVLYLPMIVTFTTSQANYHRCMEFLSRLMVAVCGIVIAQHVSQVVFSWQVWPNLNKLLPPNFLIQNFNYVQPIVWGMRYMKPNGIFFLEVSFLSQYIALALAVEIAIFKRPWRLMLFSAVLLSTFAGTGLLLMLLTIPVLIGRTRIRSMTTVILMLCIVAYASYKLGWFDLVSHRLDEFNKAGRSANMRFIEPLNRLIAAADRPGALLHGIGAGQIEKTFGYQWWPITKAVVEYGFLPGLIFYTFFLYTLFDHPPSRRLAFTLAVWFSIEGALLTSVNPLTCALMSTLFFLPRQERGERKDGQGDAAAQSLPAMQLGALPAMRERVQKEPKKSENVRNELKNNGWPDQAGPGPIAVGTPVPPVDAPLIAAEPIPPTIPSLAVCDPHIAEPDTAGRLIYAVGDVHGRADLLAELIGAIEQDIPQAANPSGEKPMIVFLGDYVDRGPQSREVLDMIAELARVQDLEVRCLMGNHEEALLDFLDKRTAGASWARHGGNTTLASYGVTLPADTKDRTAWSATREQFEAAIPEEHVSLMRGMRDTFAIGDLLFVHAGVRPGVPLEEQNRRDLLYIRPDFLNNPVDCGKLVVHGHTPQERAYGAPGRLCLDSGAYATGVLTAARFDGSAPVIIEAGRRTDGEAVDG